MRQRFSNLIRSVFPPATLDQFGRFRRQKRAWISLWLLLGLYAVSLLAGLIANGTPWKVQTGGRTVYPWFQHVTQNDLLGDGVETLPDYHALIGSNGFQMSWTAIPYGPANTLSPDQIPLPEEVRVLRLRQQRVGYAYLNAALKILKTQEGDFFFGDATPVVPVAISKALAQRFANQAADATEAIDASGRFVWSLSGYEPRRRASRSARVLLREVVPANEQGAPLILDAKARAIGTPPDWFGDLPEDVTVRLSESVAKAMQAPVDPLEYEQNGQQYELRINRETIQFPFRPVTGHLLGLDESGRDVLVLILYATRIALSFGFVLVICSVILGTLIGGLQGYYGGWLDLVGQRLIEVYESIPFLYVMIFLGSVFGRSFGLLLFVYAMFNWVGISYYMRSEYLRGRRQDYAEAARALGLPDRRVMWRHILPNSLVPVITLFPFMLVGAIGSLNALDYLGFGMPVGTPSWGDLLRQAQRYRYAWWLIAYPSLALFTVILLGVFVGEGLRSAFDPKRATRWEA